MEVYFGAKPGPETVKTMGPVKTMDRSKDFARPARARCRASGCRPVNSEESQNQGDVISKIHLNVCLFCGLIDST